MMSRAVLSLCAALTAAVAFGPAEAQQARVPPAQVDGQPVPAVPGQSVPIDQPAQTGTVEQPGFQAEAQAESVPQPRFVRAPGTGGIEVSPLAPPAESGANGDAGAGVTVIQEQPDGLTPRGPNDAALIEGDTNGRAAARASRFKSPPQDVARLSRPTGPAIPIDAAPTELRQGVRLRELDKMTGQTETFELAVGETRQIDRLKVRLDACRSPQGNDTHGAMAFLKVWDIRTPDEEAFSGWMFAESPSLSALDHPRYDLWVISCTTSSVAAASPSK